MTMVMKDIAECLMGPLLYQAAGFLAAFLTADVLRISDPAGPAFSALLGAVLGIPVLLWLETVLTPEGRRGRERNSRKTDRRMLLPVMFLGGAACSFLLGKLMEISGLFSDLPDTVQEGLLAAPLLLQVISLGLLVPIAEELCYRGLCYRQIKRRLGTAGAVFFTSLLFAAGHGNIRQAVYAFPMALLLALCLETEGSLAGPIAFHIGANLLTVCFRWFH